MNSKAFYRSGFFALMLGSGIILLYPVLVFPKGELELMINQHHFPVLDFWFKYITNIGDGVVMAVLLLVFLFYNYYLALLTLVSIVVQTILVSIFKRWLFEGMERPLAFFGEDAVLNFVEGVAVHSTNTFPSGHTTTGFAVAALAFIAFNSRGHLASIFWFLIAMMVGFSRVYLLQHFVVDVYAGALFGLISVISGLALLPLLFDENKLKRFKSHSLLTLMKKDQTQH
ncbi:MAG: phosphatase PAP2 family protein [Cyclobacteriaceae bacterium]|nr:phosphatase PAP2 family protein [Cyclobacteriaceae bacterium]